MTLAYILFGFLAFSSSSLALSPLGSNVSRFARDGIFVSRQTVSQETPLGLAQGISLPSGVHRFAVKYASANRWASPALVTTWDLPNGSTDPSDLPLACPQPDLDSSGFTEDCLSMIIYVPPSISSTSAAPTMMWVHGGSFIIGSASGPELDGSNLAIATDSIVAVVQYRLGALGFLSPNGATNLAVEDLVAAATFLNSVVPIFGGTTSKIILAGQSSGANMIRALLAAPSASSLFHSAILQSDPMNYGFLSTTIQQGLQSFFNGQINCDLNDTACLNALPVGDILDAQTNVFSNAPNIEPAAGPAQPIRPVLDGSLITSPLDSTAPFPSVNKHLLISTVKNDAAFAIYGAFPDALPEDVLEPICDATFGDDRAQTVLSSPFYPPLSADMGDARAQLEKIGTDYLWRCSSWTFARSWVSNGGVAFVGRYEVGATFPGNEQVPFCTQPGSVCHQDDIMIVFGTVPSPTPVQAALTSQMQQRYKAFLGSGDPNVSPLPAWTAATSSDVHPIELGGSGEVPLGACDPSFWGSSVTYDYQFFDL